MYLRRVWIRPRSRCNSKKACSPSPANANPKRPRVTKGGRAYRRALLRRFRRVVTLPEDADPDGVVARYRDGVLQISVKRKQAPQPRCINIQ